MQRHQKLVHNTDVSSVKCGICGCLCSTDQELFNHTVLNHGGKGRSDSTCLIPKQERLDPNLNSDPASLDLKQEHVPDLLQKSLCTSRLDPSLDHDGFSLDPKKDCSPRLESTLNTGRLEPDLNDDHGQLPSNQSQNIYLN